MLVGGNHVSFVGTTQTAVNQDMHFYTLLNGGDVDIQASKAYFLINKANIVGLLNTFVAHDPEAWASSWLFLQNGLIAQASPRKTWSHNE